MSMYYHGGKGYHRGAKNRFGYAGEYDVIILVRLPAGEGLRAHELMHILPPVLTADICYPAGDSRTFLVLCLAKEEETYRSLQRLFGQDCIYKIFRGGIFNPYLPIRVFDLIDTEEVPLEKV